MISKKLNLFCPRIGKNASSAIVEFFREFDPGVIDEGHEALLDTGLFGFLTGNHRCRPANPEFYKECYIFAVVRNPFDRLVSAWFEYRRPGMFKEMKRLVEGSDLEKASENFNVFVDVTLNHDHIHWQVQHDIIYLDGDNGKPMADLIIKFEHLNDGLRRVCDMRGLDFDSHKLPIVRKSEGKDGYRQYYNQESIYKVASKYEKDLLYFDYSF